MSILTVFGCLLALAGLIYARNRVEAVRARARRNSVSRRLSDTYSIL